MRTTTIECSSPTVGSVQPSQVVLRAPAGAFSYPLLNRRTANSPNHSNKFHFYVKVDAATILPDNLKKWSDYANYLQHRIIVGRMYWQAKETGFVSLHRRTLERAVHHSILSPVLKWLLENRVIERDGSRADGTGFTPAKRTDGSDGISIGYRFCAAYDQLPTQWVACRSVKANNKFLKLQHSRDRMKNYTKVHKHLRAWLRRVNLDLPTALKLIEAANLEPTIAEQVINLSAYIANGDATDLTVCNYGRVHTAITRLLALIRGCLSITGQPLVETDVANSQPLFLVIYILKSISNPRIKTLPDILCARSTTTYRKLSAGILDHDELGYVHTPVGSSCCTGFCKTCKTTHPHPTQPFLPTLLLYDPRKSKKSALTYCNSNNLQQNENRSPYLPPDLLLFMELCMAGTLYDYLMKRAGWTDRGSFKKEFFLMLYGPMKENPMTQIMTQEFPSVMAFIAWHKGRHGYKELSREMQRAESRLMIEGVCGSLMEQNRNIPLVTIHDSIMTTEEFIPTVKSAIIEEFCKLGIQPTVKTKRFESAASLLLGDGDFNPWENAA